MLNTLTDPRRRHNLQLAEQAFGHDEGKAGTSSQGAKRPKQSSFLLAPL
jgi:hypothetical protein